MACSVQRLEHAPMALENGVVHPAGRSTASSVEERGRWMLTKPAGANSTQIIPSG
jgi:hypothetical protein